MSFTVVDEWERERRYRLDLPEADVARDESGIKFMEQRDVRRRELIAEVCGDLHAREKFSVETFSSKLRASHRRLGRLISGREAARW